MLMGTPALLLLASDGGVAGAAAAGGKLPAAPSASAAAGKARAGAMPTGPPEQLLLEASDGGATASAGMALAAPTASTAVSAEAEAAIPGDPPAAADGATKTEAAVSAKIGSVSIGSPEIPPPAALGASSSNGGGSSWSMMGCKAIGSRQASFFTGVTSATGLADFFGVTTSVRRPSPAD
jgi:hypothetical protein